MRIGKIKRTRVINMFKIEYDNKDFIAIMRSLASICAELVLEINDEGAKIRNVSANTEVAVTVDMDKDDHKAFEYDGKNSTFMTIPYGEYLKSMKKIKVPVNFTESGKSAVIFQSGKVKYVLQLLDEDPDIYANHDIITKKFVKDKRTHIKLSSADVISLVDQLSIADAMNIKIENKTIFFESLTGNLTAGYEFEVDVPDTFKWETAFSMVYMELLAKLAVYTKELNLYLDIPASPDDDVPPIIVEMDVSANSSVKLIIGTLDKDAAAGVGVDILEEDEEDTDLEEDDFDFEEDDSFYEEDDE